MGRTKRSDRFPQGSVDIGEKGLAPIGVDGEEIGATRHMGATVIRHGGIIPPMNGAGTRPTLAAVNHDPNNLIRTQDLEPWFEENPKLHIFSPESFRSTNARVGKKPLLLPTPRLESVDIDDQEGWNLAELIALSFAKLAVR